MKKMLIVSLGAAAFAGCVTQYNEPPPPQQPRTVTVSAPQADGVQAVPQASAAPGRKVAGWAERPLRVLGSLDDGLPADRGEQFGFLHKNGSFSKEFKPF